MGSNLKNYSIAVFDFDHTLVHKDSLFHFSLFCFGVNKMLKAMFFLFPVLLLNRMGFTSSDKAKTEFMSFFFKGMKETEFREKCVAYSFEIEKILRKEALEKLNWHKNQGHHISIVSASVEDWIKPWALQNGVDTVISTKIEIRNGKVTGELSTPNCKGGEKVKRFLEQFPKRKEYALYAYGDSEGDKEMLRISDYPFYKKFN